MKHTVIVMFAVFTSLTVGFTQAEEKAAKKEKAHPILGQSMKSLTGKKIDLAKYKGKVLLIVNTASECGATPQYEALQTLHEKYADKGLVVLGFPCNQFGGQEPGTEKEIASFCKKNYGVTFDMFAKVETKGKKAAPLFKYLTSKNSGLSDSGPVGWNFEKFLISKTGKPAARFRTSDEPDSEKVLKAIEVELQQK